MAKRVEGVTEKLLECAKQEFLEKGYENASLRSIAKKANSSKGAIYIRYPDKESLFIALVKPTADELVEIIKNMQLEFLKLQKEKEKQNQNEYMNKFSDDGFSVITKYIYDNFDTFKLILTCSNSSIYNEFMHKLVKVNVNCTFKYIESIGNDAVSSGRLTESFAHLIVQAFFTGIFEAIVHDFSFEKAKYHISALRKFYNAGWNTILNP